MPLSDHIVEYSVLYAWLIVTTFINVVAPLNGSTVVNPVIAYVTDPQRAIGIASFIFVCTGLHRVYIFRAEIFESSQNRKLVQKMLPYTIGGAIAGSLVISRISESLLALVIIVVSLFFIYTTIRQILRKKTSTKLPLWSEKIVFVLSAFMQGAGMPGSDIRNNYLRTIVSEVSVRAVGTVFGIVNFFIAGTVILLNHHLTRNDLIFVVSVIPLLLPVQVFGKVFLRTLSDRVAKTLAISFSLLGTVLLVHKYFF